MAVSTSIFEVACCAPLSYLDEEEHFEILNQKVAPESRQHEVTGWTLDSVARGVTVIGAAVFVSTALLTLAKEAAGCETASPDNDDAYVIPECGGRIFGMRPTSLLTNIVMISALVSAALMPFVGSLIDHTPYRRSVGRISAACLAFLILLQIYALRFAWFLAAIIQVIVAFLYSVHLCAVFAYLPELTNNTETLVEYTSRFTAAQYGASVVFLLTIVGVLNVAGIGYGQEVLAAQVSQTTVFIVITLFFGIAWSKMFQERQASHTIPQGTTLVNAGFVKLFRTAQEITTHHRALKWFLVSAAMTQSATTSFSSIAITYMTDQLLFGPEENAISIFLLLVFAVPGAKLAQVLTRWISPIQSLKCCLLLWMVATASASFLLRGKGQELVAYGFAVVWGLCMGWVYPTEKALYCSIIPSGQDAELMGVYIFACQIFSWLPPFVFSLMNETGFSMRTGLFSLNGYFFISFIVLQNRVGDYGDAVLYAESFSRSRHKTDQEYLPQVEKPSVVESEDDYAVIS
jgi:MFS-type transporter involved in bile tolerance (Atg22 family)